LVTVTRAFIAVVSVLFVLLSAATVIVCASMHGGMPMPGGWTMSMAWMRMPGHSWTFAAAIFLGMWSLMMTAMMLPCLGVMLARYRESVTTSSRSPHQIIAVAAAYLLVWIAAGALVYPIGVAIAAIAMRSPSLARAIPFATAAVMLLAGLVQWTSWKQRRLQQCCDTESAPTTTPWRFGVRLGVRCSLCCATFMTAFLVTGVMSIPGMAAATLAITVERIAPRPALTARLLGVVMIAIAPAFL
jgi:predicted metal-binding membrane protein